MKRNILILLCLAAVVLISAVSIEAIKGPQLGTIAGYVYINGCGVATTVHLQGYGSDEYEQISREVQSGGDGSFTFGRLPCGSNSTGGFRIWARKFVKPYNYFGVQTVGALIPPDCDVSVNLHLGKPSSEQFK